MRNTLEYPVTFDEVIKTLTVIRSDILKLGLIGDMRPMILDLVKESLLYDGRSFREYLRSEDASDQEDNYAYPV